MVERSSLTVLEDTLLRKRRYAIFVGMVIASALTVRAQILPPSPQMPDARRGEHVVLRLRAVPTSDARIVISRDGAGAAGTLASIDQGNLTATFTVDSALSPGRYIVKLLADGREEQVPGELRVLPDNVPPVHIDEIYPNVRYPDSSDTIELVGANFAELPGDNHIEFVGQPAPHFGTEERLRWPDVHEGVHYRGTRDERSSNPVRMIHASIAIE